MHAVTCKHFDGVMEICLLLSPSGTSPVVQTQNL